jgi:hypothetical protein
MNNQEVPSLQLEWIWKHYLQTQFTVAVPPSLWVRWVAGHLAERNRQRQQSTACFE